MTTTPTLEEWRELYDLMGKVKELAPWQWMKETDVFGVQHPETAELGFVSVIGMSGDYYAVAVYLGPAALYDFEDLQDAGPSGFPAKILEIPQLQASFTGRQDLQKEEYEIIKQLGLRFRGKSAWPCFRSHQPGCMPWLIGADEARLLTWTLEQTLEIAPRFKETPALLNFAGEESYLVRIPIKGENGVIWRDQVMQILRPEPERIALDIAEEFLESLTHLTRAKQDIEIDVVMLPSPFRGEATSPRPFFPYMVLLVSAQNGMVLGTDMLAPLPSLNAMRSSIPAKIFTMFEKLGILPERVLVSSDMLFDLLEPVTQNLNVKLQRTRKLTHLEQVKQTMFQYFR